MPGESGVVTLVEFWSLPTHSLPHIVLAHTPLHADYLAETPAWLLYVCVCRFCQVCMCTLFVGKESVTSDCMLPNTLGWLGN